MLSFQHEININVIMNDTCSILCFTGRPQTLVCTYVDSLRPQEPVAPQGKVQLSGSGQLFGDLQSWEHHSKEASRLPLHGLGRWEARERANCGSGIQGPQVPGGSFRVPQAPASPVLPFPTLWAVLATRLRAYRGG